MSKHYAKEGCYKIDQVLAAFVYASTMSKDDIVFAWNKQHADWSMATTEEHTAEIASWRKLALDGKLAMIEYNNKGVCVNGVNYYTLVTQVYKNGRLDENDGFNMWDTGALALGTMVSGATYYYKKKENRDKVFKYVMKNIEVKDK